MTDQFAGHEIARHEITRQEIEKLQDMKMQDMNMTGEKWRQGVKLREKKSTVLQWSVQIFKPTRPQHCNTLCIMWLFFSLKNLALSNDKTAIVARVA